MMPSMTRWLKKLHMYAGLLNLTILLVFGIAGLTATFDSGPGRTPFPAANQTLDFKAPENVTDYGAAVAAFQVLKPPLADAPAKQAVHRDSANNVSFTLYSVSGIRTVTLLEKENRVRLEARRNNMGHFFDNLHSATMNYPHADLVLSMWTWYTEFSIWSLIFMSVTGVYLWLASRPKHRWAQFSFAAGSGLFLLLYTITR
jgi:hypothetical protein